MASLIARVNEIDKLKTMVDAGELPWLTALERMLELGVEAVDADGYTVADIDWPWQGPWPQAGLLG
jgi:hypothetical protein